MLCIVFWGCEGMPYFSVWFICSYSSGLHQSIDQLTNTTIHQTNMPVPPRSRNVTYELWWRHNAKSEKKMAKSATDNSLAELCVPNIKHCVRNKMTHLPWITMFWSLVMRCADDFSLMASVTRENYWQIASLVTQKSLFTVTHALFYIFYIAQPQWILNNTQCWVW